MLVPGLVANGTKKISFANLYFKPEPKYSNTLLLFTKQIECQTVIDTPMSSSTNSFPALSNFCLALSWSIFVKGSTS